MTVIEYNDVIGPCIVTALSAYQMATFQRKVARARKKFKVMPPETTGDEGFVRVFRAHQNCVETYSMFLASLWSSSLLLHQGPSSVIGIVYMFGRAKYFRDYSEATEKRMGGFKISISAIVGLSLCSFAGFSYKVFRYFCTLV